MKRCSVCQTEFDDSAIHCGIDGNRLEESVSQPEADQGLNKDQPLSGLISAEAPMEIERAVRLATSICDALEGLHRRGQYLGSLHPQDILIEARDQLDDQPLKIKLLEGDSSAREKVPENASNYLAPETAQRQETGAASDVYSLGAILYEMLTGHPPFEASSAAALVVKQLLEHPRPLRDVRPEIPAKLGEVILRALDKEKSARQQSAAQFKRELEEALSQSIEKSSPRLARAGAYAAPVAAQAPMLPITASMPGASKSSKKIVIAAVAGAVILLAVLAVAALLTLQSRSFESRQPANTNASAPQAPAGRPGPSGGGTTPPPSPGSQLPVYIALAAVAVFILVVIGGSVVLVLVLRRRKALAQERPALPMPPQYSVPHSPIKPEAELQTPPAPQPIQRSDSEQITIKKCPACDTEFPTTAQFCVHDGTPLTSTVRGEKKEAPSFYDLQTVETTKQCPKCGTGYPLAKKFCRFDGEQLVSVTPAPPEPVTEMEPFLIGQYACFARLGEGGMGVVYKARHVHLERVSAVKVLLPRAASQTDAIRLFRREARLASSINHPNSVIIYDYGEVDSSLFYLAMEFIPGKTLADILHPKGKSTVAMPLPRAMNIVLQICDALDAAHQMGIVHRDLKPHNVMICERASRPDLVKVVDFGIARSLSGLGDGETLRGIMGTPAYMSPEQAGGMPDLDGRSDIFSLAVMVYETLGGALPFPGGGLTLWQQILQRANLREPPPPLRSLRPDLNTPFAVDLVLMRAMEPNRNRRIQSATEFSQELAKAAKA